MSMQSQYSALLSSFTNPLQGGLTNDDGSITFKKSTGDGHVAVSIPDWQQEYIDNIMQLPYPDIPTDLLEDSGTAPTLTPAQQELWQRMADDVTRRSPTSQSDLGPDVG